MLPPEFIIKRFYPLLLILISVSFSQETINYETTLIKKGQLFYTKDTNKPYSGPVFSLFTDGKKKEEGNLKDGKMINKTKWKWYKNGQKYREITYQDGELINERYWTEDGLDNGEFILFYKNRLFILFRSSFSNFNLITFFIKNINYIVII